MPRWMVIYNDEWTEVRRAETIMDVLFQISNKDDVHTIIRLA